jgi:hypothetical protein
MAWHPDIVLGQIDPVGLPLDTAAHSEIIGAYGHGGFN